VGLHGTVSFQEQGEPVQFLGRQGDHGLFLARMHGLQVLLLSSFSEGSVSSSFGYSLTRCSAGRVRP